MYRKLLFLCAVSACSRIPFLSAQTGYETIPAGSYVVNMGGTQNVKILKAYGLLYNLLSGQYVPVKWCIRPDKTRDGVDFTIGTTVFQSGAFVIPKQYRTSTVNSIISTWEAKGVSGITTTKDESLPVYATLNGIPRWFFVLDLQNGSIARGYLRNAEIPDSASGFIEPKYLNCCHDLFVMPHADPVWSSHARLYTWTQKVSAGGCRGGLWAACHAVSALENMVNPANLSQQTNFLSTSTGTATKATNGYADPANALILWTDHSDGTTPYSYRYPTAPEMQFLGSLDGATTNGSEQIFIPVTGGGWRSSTKIGVWDPDHSEGGAAPREAAVLAWGPAKGDPDAGLVMYEAGHNHSKAAAAPNITAQRAFFNMSLSATIGGTGSNSNAVRVVSTWASGSNVLKGGNLYFGMRVAGGGGSYTFRTGNTCGGTLGFTKVGSDSVYLSFTAPNVSSLTDCFVTAIAKDGCGRETFYSWPVRISPSTGNRAPTVRNDSGYIAAACNGQASLSLNVLANDHDSDGQPLTASLVSVTNGTATLSSNGNLVFKPQGADGLFSGMAYVQYKACDNNTPTPACTNGTVVIQVGTQNGYGCWSNESWGLANTFTCDTFLNNQIVGLDTTSSGGANDVENAYYDPDAVGCELDNTADRLVIGFTNNTTQTMKQNLDTILIHWKPISNGTLGSPSLKVEVSANGSTWVNGATYTRNNTTFVTDTLKNPLAGARYVRISVTANVVRKPQVDAVEFRQHECNSIVASAENGMFTMLEDQTARIPVLGLVTSARGLPDTLIRLSNGPYNGYASINPDQTVSYVPFADFDGKDSFTFTVVNTRNMRSSAKVLITVQPDLCSSGQRGGSYKDTTIAVVVERDAYLRQERATTNYGNENRLKMGWGDRNNKEYRSVLYFNLNTGGAAIPTSASILDSRLELYRNGGKDNVTVDLFKINGSGLFVETQVNWTRRLNATNWATAGGDFAATLYGQIATGAGGSANNAWHYSSQMNSLVQDWVSTPANNLGMLAKRNGVYKKSDLAQFESDDAARKPILRVRYSTVTGCQAIPNQKPLIIADYDTVTFPASVSRNVVANDRDLQGTSLNLASTAPFYKVYGGTATRSGNTITFTPSRGFNGRAYVAYRVTDGSLIDTGWYFIECLNAPPVAVKDSATIATTGSSVTINVLGNDYDPEGASLTPEVIRQGSKGIAVLVGTQMSYTAQSPLTGLDTFWYRISEPAAGQCSEQQSDTAWVVVRILNRKPVARKDTAHAQPCETIQISVLNNDSDPDGHQLQITGIAVQPKYGTVSILSGKISYTGNSSPTPFVGKDSFRYVIADNGEPPARDSAWVFVDVQSGNNLKPLAINDTLQTTSEKTFYLRPQENDSDPEARPLYLKYLSSFYQPKHGTVKWFPSSGMLSYTPAKGFSGLDSFHYIIRDTVWITGAGCPPLASKYDTGTVYAQVLYLPEPEAVNLTYAINDNNNTWKNELVGGWVLTNDFDPEQQAIQFNHFFRQNGSGTWLSSGDTLSGINASGQWASFAGTLQYNSSGRYLFTPAPGFTGMVRVSYGICDTDPASPACDTAILTISVDPYRSLNANGLIADADVQLTCTEAISTNLIKNDDDAEGDVFRISGWLMDSDADAVPDSLVAPGDTVWVTGTDYLGYKQFTAGRMSMDSFGNCYFKPDAYEGTYFTGQVSAAYFVYDNAVGRAYDTALLKVEVVEHPGAMNERPFVGDDFAFTEAGLSVTGYWATNDVETNGDSVRLNGSRPVLLSALPVSALPLDTLTTDSGGRLVFFANGRYRYTPPQGFIGNDQARYTLCDVPHLYPGSRCATGTVYFLIGYNDSTIAVNDVNFTWMNTPVAGLVCTNDIEPSRHLFDAFYGCATCSRLADTALISGFNMEGNPVAKAGTFITENCGYRFQPADGFTGHVDLWYVVCDNYFPFRCDTAMLRINVDSLATTNGNNLIASNDYLISYAAPVWGQVLSNDADPEGDAFAVHAYRLDSNGDGILDSTGVLGDTLWIGGLDADGRKWSRAGSFVLPGDGNFYFQPTEGYYGTVFIEYTARDSGVLPADDQALLFITVFPSNGNLNDLPFAGDDFALTQIGKPVIGHWAVNDMEPNSDSILVNGVNSPLLLSALPLTALPLDTLMTQEGGTLILFSNGTFSYLPDTGYIGPDFVVYTLCDKTSVEPQPLCASATIYLLVSPKDPTVAVNDFNNTWQNIPVSGNLCTNDFDPELHHQSFSNLMTADGNYTVLNSPAVVAGVDANGHPVDTAGLLYFTGCSYTFVPATGFTGTAHATYAVCDDGVPSACDTALLSISVDSLPRPGYNNVIANDDMGVCINASLSSNVLLNDGDPEGDPFSVQLWYYDANGDGVVEIQAVPGSTQIIGGRDIYGTYYANAGTMRIDSNGAYTYTPAGGFYGTVALSYTIVDQGLIPAHDSAMLFIHSLQPNGPLNDPPFAGDDFALTHTDSSVWGSWAFNDTEPNGDSVLLNESLPALLLSSLSGTAVPLDTVLTDSGGVLIFYSNGSFLYTPDSAYFGPDRAVYTLCDLSNATPQPLCASATVYLLVSQAPLLISGTVYDDANGGSPNGIVFNKPSGSQLYAYLVKNGWVLDSAKVGTDGTYLFDAGRAYDSYEVILSTASVPIGSAAPARSLPANWVYVSEALGVNNGSGSGNDMPVNGLLPLKTGVLDPYALDFGLNYLPFAHDKTYTVNPDSITWKTGAAKGGFERMLCLNALSGTNDTTFNSGSSSDMPGKLSGYDLEEGRINGLTGGEKFTLVLETLPDTNNAVLTYPVNGKYESFFDVFVVVEFWDTTLKRYVIPNFDPDSLCIKFKLAGQSSTSFDYSYMDSSGLRGMVATYLINFASPLPLTLMNFRCADAPSGVVLQWAAIPSNGTEQFGVLHSTDGKNWKLLETLEGGGVPGELRHYWWKHERPSPGFNAYRLRIFDAYGALMLGPVCATQSTGIPATRAHLYPNPARTSCRLAFALSEAQIVNIRVLSSSGKEARCVQVLATAGNNDVEIMLDELEAGLYFISAEGPEIQARFRLVLQD